MIGFVIVSHSARLAEGVCELAGQVAQGKVRLAPAGGTGDPAAPLGTDAFRVLAAIDAVYSEDGVLVFTDLGSAVLSAETALDMVDDVRRTRVRLCAAPLVEGAVAAASQAGAGAGMDEILREAAGALAAKVGYTGEPAPPHRAATEGAAQAEVTVPNRLGLHARRAAQLVRLARRFRAEISIANASRGTAAAAATGIGGMLGLGARQGHVLQLRAHGPDAGQAIAEVAAFIASACGEEGAPASSPPPGQSPAPPGQGRIIGLPASAGIAIGPLVKLRPAPVLETAEQVEDPAAETQRLLTAIRDAREETRALYEWARAHVGANEAGVFDAQLLFLEDGSLIDSASRALGKRRCSAETAWQSACREFAARMDQLDDPYLRARAADVADVAARVLRRLTGHVAAPPALSEPAIVAARDIAPSEVKDLDPALVLGLCLETGSASAHSVILARAMGIPAVVGLGPGISALADGTTVALDGEQGIVWVSPAADEAAAIEERRRAWLAAQRQSRAQRHQPAATRDGRRVRVFANIGSVPGAAEALEFGAEGVGVLRTEFLFLGRASAPGEEEQFAAYRAIAEVLGARLLVIRTLDVGGDKSLPYVETAPEANPFLGWRGIRLTLGRRDLLRTQLRAILRAGTGHHVEVLFPMISAPAELREACAIVEEVRAELAGEGAAFDPDVRIGAMIEVPAAVMVADQLAREADFFSIGTNDLVQYAMAADRTNARVASLADPFQPAVLRMLAHTIEAGRAAGIGVTLCGELAADPLATALLIGLGLEEFSVSAPLVPNLKQAIARTSAAEAGEIARQALALDDARSVRLFLAGQTAARDLEVHS